MFIDPSLLHKVKLKVECIGKLKEALASALVNEVTDVKTLRSFQSQLEAMQTTDFSLEISRLKEKIKLMADVSETNENKRHAK